MHMRAQAFSVGQATPRTTRIVQCRFGGSDLSNSSKQPPKLIIPGQNNNMGQSRPGGGSSKLIIPTPSGPGANTGSGSLTGLDSDDAPVMQNFRPPPGFMDADNPKDNISYGTPQEMLNRLQAQAGHWHELAKLFPALQREGYDSSVVEEMTGLERKLQNVWSSAGQIYYSLKKNADVSPEALAYYDQDGGEYLLYELRFLTNQQRKAAVSYIYDNALDATQCKVLARAIKEHERRGGFREGFTVSPGDCLAYKHYRDALECRKQDAIEGCIKKGLAVVESESARAKLVNIFDDSAVGAAAFANTLPTAVLSVLRLDKEEVGYRPVPMLGPLKTATAESLRNAPKVSTVDGSFGSFIVPQTGLVSEWVPLPAWAIVALAGRPVGLFVENCAELPALLASTGARTEEDAKKLKGPGLLVVDAQPSGEVELDAGSYYLLAGPDGGVELTTGDLVGDKTLLGPALFLCRPPARDTLADTTAELLSV